MLNIMHRLDELLLLRLDVPGGIRAMAKEELSKYEARNEEIMRLFGALHSKQDESKQ